MALTDSILNYWKFDESSGNAADSVGSSTLTNIGSATYSTGVINNGVYVNGSSQRMTGTIADIDGYSSGWSTAGWVYWDSSTSSQKWFFNIPESAGWGTCFIGNRDGSVGSSGTNFVYKIGTGTSNEFGRNSGTAIPVATWTFVALTMSSGGVRKFYVNGSQVDTVTLGSPANNSTTLNLGAANGEYWWNGRLDEWGIWGRELTSGEVSQLYNGGAGLSYPFTLPYQATPMMHHMATAGGLM